MKKSTDSLRSIRKAAGYTLDDLARETGVPRSTIGAFEKGTRPLSDDALQKIAAFLGVEKSGISTDNSNQNFLRKVMPPEFFDEIEAQWAAQTTEQLKTLLQHKVDRNDWGAVQLVARKLQDRELTEFNQKLLKGENPV